MPKRKKPIQGRVVQRQPRKVANGEIFLKFVQPFQPKIKAMAKNFARGSATLAEDLAAEAVAKIFASTAAYDHRRPIQPFVLAIARNAMFDFLRSEKRYKVHVKRVPLYEFLSIVDSKAKQPWQKISKPTRNEIVAAVMQLLERGEIGPKTKETFIFFTGLEDRRVKSYEETAKHFSIPIGTVKSRIWLARKMLNRLVQAN